MADDVNDVEDDDGEGDDDDGDDNDEDDDNNDNSTIDGTSLSLDDNVDADKTIEGAACEGTAVAAAVPTGLKDVVVVVSANERM